MNGPPGPVTLRLLLDYHMRQYRQPNRSRANLFHLHGAAPTTTGLELGVGTVRLRDLLTLCELYGVDDHDERAQLLDFAQVANIPAWWEAFADIIPATDILYLGLEQEAAESLWTFRPNALPSLLHTPDYAWAALTQAHPSLNTADLDYRLALLLHRQKRLLSGDLTMMVVFTETALTHAPGDRRVLFRQLERLEDLCDHPNLTIRITPATHAFEPVSLFHLLQPDLAGVADLVDGPPGMTIHRPIALDRLFLPTALVHLAEPACYLDQPADIAPYRRLLADLATRAPPAHETPQLLHAIRRGL